MKRPSTLLMLLTTSQLFAQRELVTWKEFSILPAGRLEPAFAQLDARTWWTYPPSGARVVYPSCCPWMDSDGLSLAHSQSGFGNAWALDIRSMSLQSLLALFENLPQVQISGPEWLADQRYDLKAVVSDEYRLQLRRRPADDANAPREVLLLALQEIGRRFQLQSHREKREMTTYVLRPVDGVVSAINRPGSASQSRIDGRRRGPHRPQFDASHGEFRAESAPINVFIIWLQNTLKRPVIDESGAAAGGHSFRLIPRGTGAAALLAAIHEQLGLQLIEENRKLEILIVDHISQTPSEH